MIENAAGIVAEIVRQSAERTDGPPWLVEIDMSLMPVLHADCHLFPDDGDLRSFLERQCLIEVRLIDSIPEKVRLTGRVIERVGR